MALNNFNSLTRQTGTNLFNSSNKGRALPMALGASLWLDAVDPSGNGIAPPNNSGLMIWKDKIDSNNFSQATTSQQPKFILNDGITGTPSIQASAASSQYYSITQTFSYASANTLVAVASVSTSSNAYLVNGNDTGNSPAFIYGFSANTFEFYHNTDRYTLGTVTSGYHILAVTQVDGSSLIGYFDGSQIFSHTPNLSFNGKHMQGLFTSTGSANFYNGSMKFFAIFKYAMTSAQLGQLFNFLTIRYNL